MLKIPNFSLCDTQILRKIKFGNFRRSKYAILVIFEAFDFDFWENSTRETETAEEYQKLPKWKLYISLPRSVQCRCKPFLGLEIRVPNGYAMQIIRGIRTLCQPQLTKVIPLYFVGIDPPLKVRKYVFSFYCLFR